MSSPENGAPGATVLYFLVTVPVFPTLGYWGIMFSPRNGTPGATVLYFLVTVPVFPALEYWDIFCLYLLGE